MNDLKNDAAIDAVQVKAITNALNAGKNVWLVGPSTSGLATLTSALLESRTDDERFVLVESTPEVALGDRSAVCLKRGEATLAGLLRSARHFRTHQLVLHDLQRDELETALSALSNGATASVATLQSTSAHDALAELGEVMRGQGLRGIDTVRRAVGLMVSVTEDPSGRPRVTAVCEVIVDGSVLKLEEAP